MRHLSWRSLIEAAESAGMKDPAAGEHLRECAQCADLLREARSILDSLEMSGAPRPSEELMDATWAVLRKEISAPPPEGVGSRLRQVWATLTGDSLRPALAVRGATEAAARSMVFETDDYAISLFISSERKKGATDLFGQVVPKTADGIPGSGRAVLVAGGASREAELSDLGEFRFREIPSGDLTLAVALGNLNICCPSFSVSG